MEFYGPTHRQEISIRDMGWVEAYNDAMCHMSKVGGLKHEEGTQDDITELKSLMRGNHIYINSADNSEILGSLSGRISLCSHLDSSKYRRDAFIWGIFTHNLSYVPILMEFPTLMGSDTRRMGFRAGCY